MADRIYSFDITVAAGVSPGGPQFNDLPIAEGIVTDVEIVIPPGPSGLVGFKLQHSTQTVIPYNAANWIITDDEKLRWSLRNFPVGNKWRLATHNLDIYPHVIYVRLLVDNTTRNAQAGITLLPIIADMPQVVTE